MNPLKKDIWGLTEFHVSAQTMTISQYKVLCITFTSEKHKFIVARKFLAPDFFLCIYVMQTSVSNFIFIPHQSKIFFHTQ